MRLLYQTLNYESLKLALRLQSLPLQSNRCKIERLFEITVNIFAVFFVVIFIRAKSRAGRGSLAVWNSQKGS